MLREYKIKTEKEGFYNITSFVRQTVLEAGIKEGIAVIFTPDTDTAVKISNTDESVIKDEMAALERAFPDYPEFKNTFGRSAVFAEAMVMGQTQTVIVHESAPILSGNQGVFLIDFNAECERHFYVKVING